MELLLKRRPPKGEAMIGELSIDGIRECYILEDVPRATKIYGKTAIPAGRYEVTVDWSPKYKKPMPHVLNVPGYEGIRIHPGNFSTDTEGCLLPGVSVSPDGQAVLQSKSAFGELFAKLRQTIERGEHVFITIEDPT